MQKTALKKILNLLKKHRKNITVPIPALWNYLDKETKNGIQYVNLYEVYIRLITDILKNKDTFNNNRDKVIYSALVRTTTAFDFDLDNKLSLQDKFGLRESGTLMRMILLLPFLKELGITVIYLLPIALNSDRYKKGDAPSLYSIKDFFKLDKYLFDPMIGKFSEELLDTQFKAFIEAAHIYGMEVILDLIPRTAARDNVLITEHPDWFYWIKKEYENDLKPPQVPNLNSTAYFPKFAPAIYSAPDTEKHLKKFTLSPDKLDKKKWQKIKRSKDILNDVEKYFGITTSPAFSDVINDTQPLWNEITFLRLFLDHPKTAVKFLSKDQAPYILYDVIKSSRAPGKIPNKKLWNKISDILPWWQKKYGIDGVRIDMAHALPAELEKMIIQKAKKINKNFLLIAEELDIDNSGKAKKAGYHAIIGNIWAEEPRWRTGNVKNVFNSLHKIKLPLLATSETHDTPRTIVRDGKKLLHLFSAALNYFLPNTMPFINSGFELEEIQPMNKGLDSEKSSIYLLPKNDLNYGKLALFNFTSLHWNNDSADTIKLMKYCASIRNKFPVIQKFNKFKTLQIFPDNKYVFAYYYDLKKEYKHLIFLVNSNLKKSYKIKFNFSIESIDSLLNTYRYRKTGVFREENVKFKTKKNEIIYKIKPGEISVWGIKE